MLVKGATDLQGVNQCWKFPQVCQSEADNFGGGPGTFCWYFFNFMFMISDSRYEDLHLFWLSFKHWGQWVKETLNLHPHVSAELPRCPVWYPRWPFAGPGHTSPPTAASTAQSQRPQYWNYCLSVPARKWVWLCQYNSQQIMSVSIKKLDLHHFKDVA